MLKNVKALVDGLDGKRGISERKISRVIPRCLIGEWRYHSLIREWKEARY